MGYSALELLLNGINGNYLRNILEKAASETERVDAAVAYATQNDLLFDWCWDNKLPLRFWGRFDEKVPVSIHVLERFLSHRSGRYVCKLVRQFHPKVIWWRGFGAYIGSANLTQSAWWNNVEAGIFLTETEIPCVEQAGDPATVRSLRKENDVVAAVSGIRPVRADNAAQREADALVGFVGSLAIGGVSEEESLCGNELAVFRTLDPHVIILQLLDQSAHGDGVVEFAGNGQRLL